MEGLRDLWANHKALLIAAIIALAAILWYVYNQNHGATLNPNVNNPNSETPTVETEQLSTILGALGQLTPVTNTLQPVVTNNTSTTTINNPVSVMPTPTLTSTLTVPPVTVTQSVTHTGIAGIGNDTARDAAISAAEKKYPGPSNAAKLQQAIAAIQKQYPRSGPTQ